MAVAIHRHKYAIAPGDAEKGEVGAQAVIRPGHPVGRGENGTQASYGDEGLGAVCHPVEVVAGRCPAGPVHTVGRGPDGIIADCDKCVVAVSHGGEVGPVARTPAGPGGAVRGGENGAGFPHSHEGIIAVSDGAGRPDGAQLPRFGPGPSVRGGDDLAGCRGIGDGIF